MPCVMPFFRECAFSNRPELFDVLDKVQGQFLFWAHFALQICCEAKDPGVAARTLACIADALGCFAFGQGGLRSGPGRNPRFQAGLQHLETPEGRSEGVRLLAQERSNWLATPEQLVPLRVIYMLLTFNRFVQRATTRARLRF